MDDDLAPYEPNELDELLSAELDGELGTAARDLDVSVEEIAARLNATPGADARRVALAAARHLLAEQPEIDELLAGRLRAKAVRAGAEEHSARVLDRRRRRRQMLVGAGGIAAAAVAVVALAAGLNGSGGGTKAASEKGTASAPTAGDTVRSGGRTAAEVPLSALGTFSDKRALAAAALAQAHAGAETVLPGVAKNGPPSPSRSVATDARTTPALSDKLAAPSTTSASAFGAAAGAAQKSAPATGTGSACPTPAGIGTDDTLVLRATATLSGKPVILFVFAGPKEHAIKIEDASCALVDIQMLH